MPCKNILLIATGGTIASKRSENGLKPLNIDSFAYACEEDSQGVVIVFDGKVIAGTRAKKVRSKSNNAFSSIDFPYLALIQEQSVVRYLPVLLEAIFSEYDCIIVESFGVGGIPGSIAPEFYRICKKIPRKPLSCPPRSLMKAAI